MKRKRYAAYKDSRVEWIGEIPAHWEVYKGKKIFCENKRKNSGQHDEDSILSLSYGEIIIKSPDKLTGLVPKSFETYQIVQSGDIIVRCTDLQNDKTSLRTAISEFNGIITNAYLNLNVIEGYPKYYHYLLRAMDLTKYIYKLGTGLRQNLSYEDFKNLQIIFPPKQEQIQIADYLDKKTAQIDKAVILKERLIERLKEQRQILINRAVIQGLDPDVPMKESGVEWIGKIPAHWEVRKFRFLFDFAKGLNITKENLQKEGIPCVNYGEIHSKYGFEVVPERDPLKCVDTSYLKTNPKSLLKRGDFVFADTSEDVEAAGSFTYLNSDTPTFAGYHTIIARVKTPIFNRFMAYFFSSDAFKDQVRSSVRGVKVYSITNAILKDTRVCLPLKQEQIQIADYLDKKTAQIDKAITLQQNQIEKLKAYKASLIDAVVTGKVKIVDSVYSK
jgi:type I restriction enzyme S subunit